MRTDCIKVNKHQTIGYAGLMLSSIVYGATPLWSYSSANPGQITVSARGTATVHYTVTNQSNKPKNLVLKTTPGLSAAVCHLAEKGSTCSLTITVAGNQIPAEGLHTGPMLCEQNNVNECFQPAAANQLRISRGNLVVVVGSHTNKNGLSTLLSVSARKQNWLCSRYFVNELTIN